jgi:hypothetical protein
MAIRVIKEALRGGERFAGYFGALPSSYHHVPITTMGIQSLPR